MGKTPKSLGEKIAFRLSTAHRLFNQKNLSPAKKFMIGGETLFCVSIQKQILGSVL